MKITFYYWGTQCPIIAEMRQLFTENHVDDITCIDIGKQPEIAEMMGLYYPFLTVFDDQLYWHEPINAKLLDAIRHKSVTKEEPYILPQSSRVIKKELRMLDVQTLSMVEHGCTFCGKCHQIEQKARFLTSLCPAPWGIVHVVDGVLKGGVEWLPSSKVPYPIPKRETSAFLTCVYHSSEQADYKSYPLAAVEKYLSQTYDEVMVISDEKSTFPNGPMSWFVKRGYEDVAMVQEIPGYARLHLLRKKL